MASGIDDILNPAGEGRRDFLRKLIAGAAFAPPLLASFSLDGLSLAEAAPPPAPWFCSNQNPGPEPSCITFAGNEYDLYFRDVFRDGDINAGLDVGGTGHSALNFTGGAGAGGGTWGTVLDCGSSPSIDIRSFISLTADVLIHPFNNSKGVGLLALAFALEGNKGLALLVSNAGNSDKLQLVTVDQADGKVVPLKIVSLGGGIKQDVWYRLSMAIEPADGCAGVSGGFQCSARTVTGSVHEHQDPSDPDSALGEPVGTLTFELDPVYWKVASEVGIVARAISAVVDSSVTNFCGNWGSIPV